MKIEIPTLQEVLKDCGGNENLLKELLCKFQLWLKQQTHLPQDISDQRLKFFISTVKFDFEKAKKNLDTLYTLHNLIPEIYSSFDPLSDEVILCNKCVQFVPLPMLSPDKYRVNLVRLIDYDDSKYDAWIVVRYAIMTTEMRIEEDIVTNNVVVWDCAGANINHMLKYTPMLLKKFDSCMKAYGLRVKAIHIINAPVFVDIIVKGTKSILRAKIFNRIHVHTSGMEALYETIPKSILPMDYGGEQPSMDTLADMWQTELIKRRDWFLKEEKRKTNESLRRNSVINPQNLFGVPGTFRQLQID